MREERTVVLRGQEALDYARRHGARLNQRLRRDGSAEGEGIAPEDAGALLERDPEQVWIEVPSGTTSAD